MNKVAVKTADLGPALTGCLAPIDRKGLDELIAKGKADPKVIKTLEVQNCRGRPLSSSQFRPQPAAIRG